MSIQENIQIAKDTFAAFGRGDMQGLLALSAEGIEWIIPGEWPRAGTHRRHAGVADLFQKISEILEISFSEPREFVAQGDRVLVLGFSRGRVKATNRTFEDHWRGASRWPRAPGPYPSRAIPHETIRKVNEYVRIAMRPRLLRRDQRSRRSNAARRQLVS